jgi:hypothetical protein
MWMNNPDCEMTTGMAVINEKYREGIYALALPLWRERILAIKNQILADETNP